MLLRRATRRTTTTGRTKRGVPTPLGRAGQPGPTSEQGRPCASSARPGRPVAPLTLSCWRLEATRFKRAGKGSKEESPDTREERRGISHRSSVSPSSLHSSTGISHRASRRSPVNLTGKNYCALVSTVPSPYTLSLTNNASSLMSSVLLPSFLPSFLGWTPHSCGTVQVPISRPFAPFAPFGTHGTIEGETDSPGRGEGRTTLTHDTRHTVLSS